MRPTRLDAGVTGACAACGGSSLALSLKVGTPLDERGLIPTTDAFGHALDDIVQCRDCGHRQIAHSPSEVELLSLYVSARADHYVHEEAGQLATAHATMAEIERHAGVGRLLDLGCWVGYLLAAARERGWDVTGVEPSDFAAEFARERLGLAIVQADLLSADLALASYDAIVLGDVLEHLMDPLGALGHIATLLTPGGVLYLTLPDAGSRLARRMGAHWWSVIPTHLHHFSRHSIRTLLRRAGYETLDIHTAPKTFTVRYYLSRLTGYSPPLSRVAIGLASALGLADRLWTPDFRDRMGIVARGPAAKV